MAPSRHDWKIVDWDLKPQHDQPTNFPSYKKWAIRAEYPYYTLNRELPPPMPRESSIPIEAKKIHWIPIVSLYWSLNETLPS